MSKYTGTTFVVSAISVEMNSAVAGGFPKAMLNICKTIVSSGKHAINRLLRPLGYQLVRLDNSHEKATVKTGGYIDAKATVQAARAAGKTVCEYVETLWTQQGGT